MRRELARAGRVAVGVGLVLVLAAFLAWRRATPREPAPAPAAAASRGATVPAAPAPSPPAVSRPGMTAPAIQLAKRVETRAARDLEPGALEGVTRRLLADPTERAQLGTRAQELVKSQQGATERTIVCLESLIHATAPHELAA